MICIAAVKQSNQIGTNTKYSPLSLTQIQEDQANHFELSVLWANQITTS